MSAPPIFEHTPSPWIVEDNSQRRPGKLRRSHGGTLMVVAEAGGMLGLTISEGPQHEPIDYANARLIAAAPESYALLKDCAHILNGMAAGTLPPCFRPSQNFIDSINSTLAKIEGKAL